MGFALITVLFYSITYLFIMLSKCTFRQHFWEKIWGSPDSQFMFGPDVFLPAPYPAIWLLVNVFLQRPWKLKFGIMNLCLTQGIVTHWSNSFLLDIYHTVTFWHLYFLLKKFLYEVNHGWKDVYLMILPADSIPLISSTNIETFISSSEILFFLVVIIFLFLFTYIFCCISFYSNIL